LNRIRKDSQNPALSIISRRSPTYARRFGGQARINSNWLPVIGWQLFDQMGVFEWMSLSSKRINTQNLAASQPA